MYTLTYIGLLGTTTDGEGDSSQCGVDGLVGSSDRILNLSQRLNTRIRDDEDDGSKSGLPFACVVDQPSIEATLRFNIPSGDWATGRTRYHPGAQAWIQVFGGNVLKFIKLNFCKKFSIEATNDWTWVLDYSSSKSISTPPTIVNKIWMLIIIILILIIVL